MIDYLGTPRVARSPSQRYDFKRLPVEGAGEDIRAGIKAAAWGIAAALFTVLFLVVRH